MIPLYFVKFKATEWFDQSKNWKDRPPGNRELAAMLHIDFKLPLELCMDAVLNAAFDWANKNAKDSRFTVSEII